MVRHVSTAEAKAKLSELIGSVAYGGDRVLIERVQAGMRAGMIDEGRLLPESEKLIAHFQALVVDALA